MNLNKKILVWAICATVIAILAGVLTTISIFDTGEKLYQTKVKLAKSEKKASALSEKMDKLEREKELVEEDMTDLKQTCYSLSILSQLEATRNLLCGCKLHNKFGMQKLLEFSTFMKKYFRLERILPKYRTLAQKLMAEIGACAQIHYKLHKNRLNNTRVYH